MIIIIDHCNNFMLGKKTLTIMYYNNNVVVL